MYPDTSMQPDMFSFLPTILMVAVPAIILIWFIATYNRIVNLHNLISESWSDINTELQRRYDLIPNLVETVKAYATHEQKVFQDIADTRSKAMASGGDTAKQAYDENYFIRSIRHLLAVSEAYPNLKADTNFLHLQQELINTEDRIQAARRFFNGNVRDYNNLASCIPSSLIASMFGFKRKDFFEIEDIKAGKPVNVQF